MDTLLRIAPDNVDALARVAQVTFEHGAPKRAVELYRDLFESPWVGNWRRVEPSAEPPICPPAGRAPGAACAARDRAGQAPAGAAEDLAARIHAEIRSRGLSVTRPRLVVDLVCDLVRTAPCASRRKADLRLTVCCSIFTRAT